MTIEEARIKLSIIKNSYSIRNYFCTDMTHQEKALIDYENLVISLIKEKQELIEYLKKEQERLAKETSATYEDGLGKRKFVNEEIYNEVSKILFKLEKSDK